MAVYTLFDCEYSYLRQSGFLLSILPSELRRNRRIPRMDITSSVKSAPNGGYGWCVCAAAFSVQFVLAGIQNSFGILLIYILDEFGNGKGTSAWVGSIHLFALYAMAPFVTIACDIWGCRITGFVGGLVCVIGLVASSFVTRLYLLFVTYGVLFGIGASLAYITTFRIISLWFDRKLALANGICSTGAYSGTIALGPFLQRMVKQTGLSRTFIILAGIVALTAVSALAYRPPPKLVSMGKRDVQVKKIFDLTLLEDKSFLVFLLGLGLYASGCFIPASYVPSFAKELGVPPHKGALLLMAWSTSSGVFSFLTGKLADKFSRYRVEIFQCAMVGVAISTSLLSAAWSFQSFMGMMVIYGAFDSGFVSLKAVVAEDLVGSDQASRGVGIMFAVLGIAYCAGIPLAGWIYDSTNSYPWSFVAASVFSATGCILLFLIPLLQNLKNVDHVGPLKGRELHSDADKLKFLPTPLITEISFQSVDIRTLRETYL